MKDSVRMEGNNMLDVIMYIISHLNGDKYFALYETARIIQKDNETYLQLMRSARAIKTQEEIESVLKDTKNIYGMRHSREIIFDAPEPARTHIIKCINGQITDYYDTNKSINEVKIWYINNYLYQHVECMQTMIEAINGLCIESKRNGKESNPKKLFESLLGFK
jgi:hypothetical protein